jgi:lipopolysaccharide biosynthesis regulator YciM
MKRDRLVLVVDMLKKNPKDVFLNYAAALEYLKVNETEKASKTFAKVIELDKNYVGAYYQLGKIYENNNELSKAIKIYQQGCEVAREQNDQRSLGELSEALMMLDEDFNGAL